MQRAERFAYPRSICYAVTYRVMTRPLRAVSRLSEVALQSLFTGAPSDSLDEAFLFFSRETMDAGARCSSKLDRSPPLQLLDRSTWERKANIQRKGDEEARVN